MFAETTNKYETVPSCQTVTREYMLWRSQLLEHVWRKAKWWKVLCTDGYTAGIKPFFAAYHPRFWVGINVLWCLCRIFCSIRKCGQCSIWCDAVDCESLPPFKQALVCVKSDQFYYTCIKEATGKPVKNNPRTSALTLQSKCSIVRTCLMRVTNQEMSVHSKLQIHPRLT